jgi:hypothetical protein
MSRVGVISWRRLRRNSRVQGSAAAAPIRLSQRLHPIESSVSSSTRSRGRLRNIRSDILVFRARGAQQETYGSRHAVDQIVGVQGIGYCFPERRATHAGLVRVLRRREGVPESKREQHCFDAHQSVGDAVEQIAVGETVGRFQDVLVDEDVEEPLSESCGQLLAINLEDILRSR